MDFVHPEKGWGFFVEDETKEKFFLPPQLVMAHQLVAKDRIRITLGKSPFPDKPLQAVTVERL